MPRSGLVVDADGDRLAQVITNLLTNAAKYTPPGGHIRVSAREDGGQVTLEVADSGAGIAPELLPRLFDVFTQGRQGLDRKQGGLGLGLAIARQLISLTAASIHVRTAGPGRVDDNDRASASCGQVLAGTRPRAQGHPPGVARCSTPRAPWWTTIRTPPALLQAAADAGRTRVRTAVDGPSALQLVQTFTPEIVFLDIGLPVMDGYELAQLLRSVPGLADTPFVAITGATRRDDDRRLALAEWVHRAPCQNHSMPDRVIECIKDPVPPPLDIRGRVARAKRVRRGGWRLRRRGSRGAFTARSKSARR